MIESVPYSSATNRRVFLLIGSKETLSMLTITHKPGVRHKLTSIKKQPSSGLQPKEEKSLTSSPKSLRLAAMRKKLQK